MSLWYLSFADPERPEGEQFLGACYVIAEDGDIRGAAKEAWDQDCNPGGQIFAIQLGRTLMDDAVMNRLLTREEAENARPLGLPDL